MCKMMDLAHCTYPRNNIRFKVLNEIFVVLLLVVLFYTPDIKADDRVKSILRKLFDSGLYDKRVRPSKNHSIPTELGVDLYLYSVKDLDEVSQSVTWTVCFVFTWMDEYLNWNREDYGGVHEIHVSQKEVWLPVMAIQNGQSPIKRFGDDYLTVSLLSTGKITWIPIEILQTECLIDISYFPFDKQNCSIILSLLITDPIQVQFAIKNITVIDPHNNPLVVFRKNNQWSITSWSQDQQKFDLTFSFVLQRKSKVYVQNILLPVVLLAFLNVLTFLIPTDCGEKMGYCTTIFLSFTVFLTYISSLLPRSSDSVSLMEMYIIINLMCGTFTITITAFQLRMCFQRSVLKCPQWFMYVVKFAFIFKKKKGGHSSYVLGKMSDDNHERFKECQKMVESSEINSNDKNTGILVRNVRHDEVTWSDLCSVLDFYCFWVLSIILIVSTTVVYGCISR